MSNKMGKETIVVSFIIKQSCQTKVGVVVVKVEKVAAKETCKVK
jgi:hypothetical protein